MAKGKGKVVNIVDEAAKADLKKKVAKAKKEKIVYDLGPFEIMCPNCRHMHTITYSDDGSRVFITQGGSKLSGLTTHPTYACPKCGQRQEMRTPQIVKEEKKAEANTGEVNDTPADPS